MWGSVIGSMRVWEGKLRGKRSGEGGTNQRLVTGCSFSAINGATLSSSVRTKHGVM